MIREEIVYGVKLGYSLGRMEFIWDSTMKEARDEFENAKKEILDVLKIEKCEPEQDSYQSFCSSILNHFERNNLNIYAMILVGIGAFRGMLVTKIDEKNPNREEMLKLAKNTFLIIPKFAVPNAMELFKKIADNEAYAPYEIVEIVLNHLNI